MNRKMREILSKIQEKTAQAKAFMEGRKQQGRSKSYRVVG